jgi:DNA-binding NarL/FixJ family response regulator
VSSYHSIIRAAYDVDRDEEAWVEGIVRATSECFGTDAGAYVVPGEDLRTLRSFTAVGDTYRAWAAAAMRMQGSVPADVLRVLYAGGPFINLWSERSDHLRVTAPPHEATEFLEAADQMQLAMGGDTIGIFGGSTNGGLMLCAHRGTRSLAPRTRWALRHVAVHIDAAFRLRSSRDVEPDAIVAETGEVLERRIALDDEAVEHGVREMTLSARLAEREPEHAVSVWRGLIAGRWSLVQAREQGRRRIMLLRRNELPDIKGDDPVARRISSVADLAARGHSNKLIAYELGLPASTVASDLRTVLTRLGLSRRTELVRLLAHVEGDANTAAK